MGEIRLGYLGWDYADWSSIMVNEGFCKHLGKPLLSLPEDKAGETLRRIYSNKERREFKAVSTTPP